MLSTLAAETQSLTLSSESVQFYIGLATLVTMAVGAFLAIQRWNDRHTRTLIKDTTADTNEKIKDSSAALNVSLHEIDVKLAELKGGQEVLLYRITTVEKQYEELNQQVKTVLEPQTQKLASDVAAILANRRATDRRA